MDNSFRAPGPAYHRLGEDSSLPAPITGTREEPPGDWADHLVKLAFPCAVEGRFIKSALLRELVDRQPRREPMLRYGVPMTGVALEFELGSSLKHVEAMYIFMVGRIADVECDTCQRDRGVFPFCVTVDLADGHVKCANCYWDNYECSKAQVESSLSAQRTISRQFGQGSRGSSNRDRATISQDIVELRAAFNLLKRGNDSVQESVTSNSTAWSTLNTTTSALVAQQGRVLRERDTRDLQRVAQRGRTQGRTVQTSLATVNNLQEEIEAILTRMEDHIRQFYR
ncbi:FAD-dependent pyridine nucleotide-disulfide oxidoreductase [Penicillium samsonianum]|uniref:FAD-dependent pyridine nucleotide-disulfide oxidoreductase n=1 Tax=Penicillium samsonianum TaxID=1882272 RepID=UPI0025492BF3|nr:FAD-dependent pyridine nucleotide-disulfide oxidoreductase [Penicillium samsonianum]KAJ6149858.1 FAD-dependent pyridine nucleotide-disulfide oxidoreductase [Penicillium samsonianum]